MPTSPPTPINTVDENVTYTTVSALANDYFHHRFHHKYTRDDALSEPELALEPRSVPEAAVTEDLKRHLSQHKHRDANQRRHHGFRRGVPGLVGSDE